MLQQAILLLASLVALFPLWFMVWTAIRSQDDYFRSPLGWPQGIHWNNFTRAFDENIGRWVLNSAIVTGGAVLLVTLISVPAAYAFVRLPFKGSAFLLKIFVFLMVIPPIVMLLPLFSLMNALGRVNHVDSVIVAYAGSRTMTRPFGSRACHSRTNASVKRLDSPASEKRLLFTTSKLFMLRSLVGLRSI